METTSGFRPTPEGFLDFFEWWFNEYVADAGVAAIEEGEAYIVWFCIVLGRAKCLVSTTRPDHRYYELTYDAERRMVYVDSYVKVRNVECLVCSKTEVAAERGSRL